MVIFIISTNQLVTFYDALLFFVVMFMVNIQAQRDESLNYLMPEKYRLMTETQKSQKVCETKSGMLTLYF